MLSQFDRPVGCLFSARYQLANDTCRGVQPTLKAANAADAQDSARLCLYFPMLESPKTVSLTISELAGEIPAAACFFLEETKNPALSNSTNFDH